MEVPANSWRSRIGLASSNADRVIALSDNWISILGHHTQIAVLQLEMNLLARARFEMNPLESAESNERSTFHGRELQIDLYDFISFAIAGIRHRDLRFYRMSRTYSVVGNTEIAVLECC